MSNGYQSSSDLIVLVKGKAESVSCCCCQSCSFRHQVVCSDGVPVCDVRHATKKSTVESVLLLALEALLASFTDLDVFHPFRL
jgi:hypothetical protein